MPFSLSPFFCFSLSPSLLASAILVGREGGCMSPGFGPQEAGWIGASPLSPSFAEAAGPGREQLGRQRGLPGRRRSAGGWGGKQLGGAQLGAPPTMFGWPFWEAEVKQL